MVTMDVGEFEGHKFVVMLDQYSWYTQAEWVRSKQPEEIIKVLMKKWISVFGVPRKIFTDSGREFDNEKRRNLTYAWNIEAITTASQSPFSNGRCERTVGLIKDGLRKMKEEGAGWRREEEVLERRKF